MAVGFVLPPGTHSRANTDQPQTVLQQFLPWGDTGNDTSGEFAMPRSPENLRFLEVFGQRYGKAKEGQPVADAPGLHHPEYEGALSNIADLNPGWFAERGFGSATGGKQPSRQEIFDAQYAANIHQQVLDESKRIIPHLDPDLTAIRVDIAELAKKVQLARDASEREERRWWHDRVAKEIAKLNGPGAGEKRAVRELQALANKRPLPTPTPHPTTTPPSGGTVADVRQDIANLTAQFDLARRAIGIERSGWQDSFREEIAKREGEGRKKMADLLRALAAERPLEGLPT